MSRFFSKIFGDMVMDLQLRSMIRDIDITNSTSGRLLYSFDNPLQNDPG